MVCGFASGASVAVCSVGSCSVSVVNERLGFWKMDDIMEMVDQAIARWGNGREVVATGEIIDLLLDIRQAVNVSLDCEEGVTRVTE